MKKRSTFYFKPLAVFTFILLSIASCKKDDDAVIVEQEFYNDGNHALTIKEDGSDVTITIYALNDNTEGIKGEWPNIDSYRLYVDFNQNGAVDANVDLLLGPDQSNTNLCIAKLTSQVSTTGCSFPPDATDFKLFGTTDFSSEEHMRFGVTVPKNLLSENNKVHVVFHVYDSESGWTYLPSQNTLFTDVLEISW